MIPTFKAHPWHGISAGEKAPDVVNVFVEIVPSDTIKYEIDKESGHLKVDRPQKFSNIIPALYGFVPRTYCDERVKELAVKKRCFRHHGRRPRSTRYLRIEQPQCSCWWYFAGSSANRWI